MKTFILPLIWLLLLILCSCKKSYVSKQLTDEQLIDKAKNYVKENLLNNSADQLVVSAYSSNPFKREHFPLLTNAYTIMFSGKKAVVFPVTYANSFYVGTNIDRNRFYKDAEITRLLLYTDQNEEYKAELITILPDSAYLPGNPKKYSGLIAVTDWWGNLIKNIKVNNDGTFNIAGSGNVLEEMQAVFCIDVYGYNYSPGTGDSYSWSYSLGCFNGGGESQGTSYSGGGGDPYESVVHGGSHGSDPTPMSSFSIVSANNPIANISEYLKCFVNAPGTDYSYQVQLCVAQPAPGSRESWITSSSAGTSGGSPVYVGHTFLILNQTSSTGTIIRNVGFYPKNAVTPFESSTQGILNNDTEHDYDIALTITMTSSQFFTILNFINQGNNPGYLYDLNSNNCTTFALNALSNAGINLPRTKGSWLGGGGLNPGDLGEDIRYMNLSSNMTRTTIYGTHPNQGECY